MALQFIYGRSHSGKTQFILDKAQELYADKKPLIIVVPEQFTHIAEKRLISRLGCIGYGRAEVLSFDRICKRINSAYPNTKKHLSPMGKSLIISEILSDINLEYYKSAASLNGFSDMCNEEISEFKKYMISPQSIFEAADNVQNKSLSLKLKDIGNIYQAYEEKVMADFSDSDDSLGILADNLETHCPYAGYTFLFDEFSSFNPQERNVISIIASQAENVYMSFCADFSNEYSGLYKPTIDSAHKVSLACKDRGCVILPSVLLGTSTYANNELDFLEKNLYSASPDKYTNGCNNIRIYTCENPYSEVINLASQILALVQKRNVRYRDISVVCSDIESYGCIIRSVFDVYGIPYFIDEKTRVLDHSIVNFVVNILDVYLTGYSGESVVNFLKSGCISADRDAICYVDNYITATRATKNTWLSDDRFEKSLVFFAEDDNVKKEAISKMRRDYIIPLASFHNVIKGKNTVRYVTEKLYKYLIDIKFDKRIAEYISYFKKENKSYLAKQYETVWNILIDALDTLVYIIGDKSVNVAEYRKFFYTALGQLKTGIIPTSIDEIVIGDIKRSKSAYADYQFVLGAVDGAFPNSSEAQSVITDAEKKILFDMGIELSPESSEQAYFDRFQIYSVFTHPQIALIVSYPASDSSFSAVRPAFAVSLLKNIFPKLAVKGGISSFDMQGFYNETTAMELLAESASAILRGESVTEDWKDIYTYFCDNNQSENIRCINRFITQSDVITRLEPELTDRLYGNDFYSTISRIQRYNSCRYSYYLEYMLKLREKKSFGIESVDIGNIIHSIIESVFDNLKSTATSIESVDRAYFEKQVDIHLDKYISELCDSSGEISERDIFSVRRLKDSIVTSLMAVRDHIACSQFEPLGHEIVFDDNNIGCIELELENGKRVKITGKIDRADSFTNEYGTFIRVIDYKTGNKTFNFTDVFYGLDVQLLVYMNALVNKTSDAYPAGALFFKIQNPLLSVQCHPEISEINALVASATRMDGVVSADEKVLSAFSPGSVKTNNKLSSAQFKQLGDYINTIIADSANSISKGYIDINPYHHSSSSSCDYCKFNSICNFSDGKNGTYRQLKTIRNTSVFKEITAVIPNGEGERQ